MSKLTKYIFQLFYSTWRTFMHCTAMLMPTINTDAFGYTRILPGQFDMNFSDSVRFHLVQSASSIEYHREV